MDERTVVLRLGLSVLLGGLLGLERELSGQSAGLRTHLLVSLGACLFTLSSIAAAHSLTEFPSNADADITRIASQVVVGIGFLGGGSILRHGNSVKGLTTAANLWLTASVGMATGMGFFLGALLTVALALLALAGLRPLERALRHRRQRMHPTETNDDDESPRSPPE
ncbi:MgtC/SapB family protein [Stigmatella aurantiaca]|uniref:MgtC family protein n=1 Tax=Stigmatella aurantiaca (strain DW4/3-1) TaxID=378806 RepID=Q09A87_STIAD|nr:MgtC/SapB family protein [Stigmatella aurantiaca]ADO75062.1 MgtC family transporter [Stigmatella aurantiaca DW4/3-1]EAU68643.1 MgtC family protein [Stigmatella aurantiaca DW4/3-1]